MKRFFKWLLPLLFIAFLFNCQKSTGTLSGKVVATNGKAPIIAHVHLLRPGGDLSKPFRSIKVNKDGTFKISLPAEKYLTLYITAAFHHPLEVPLVRKDKNQSVELDFQLACYRFKKTFDQVKILGDWNDFAFSTAQPMQKQADGTFTFDVHPKADTVAYQLLGLTLRERSLNGTQFDYLVYDHGGDYRSVLRKTDSVMHIVFDPKKIPYQYNDALPKVLLKKGTLLTQDFMDIKLLVDRYQNNWGVARQQYVQKFGTDRGFRFDFTPLLRTLDKMRQDTQFQMVKDYIDMQRVQLARYGLKVDNTLYKKLADHIPADDPMWTLNPQILPFVLEKAYGKEKARQMLEQALPKISNPFTKAFILVRLGMEAKINHDKQRLTEIYNQLKSGYSDIYFVKYYLKMLNPEARIAVGKPIPDFSFKDMFTGKEISNKTLKGKFYIMDFWATWCKPCLGELPFLTKAYQTYKNKNFTIVSVSFDRSPEDVIKFRKGKFKMPWHHVFLDKSIRDKVGDTFEVGGIPKPILVSPEGVIIAMENEIRGENLAKTLQKYLQ